MPATHAGGNLYLGYGATITVQVTNGGTGPTIPANITVQVSADNTTFVQWAMDTAGVTASTTYSFGYQLPPEIAYARVVVGSNTAQSVTGVAQYNLISAL
jgi:CO/xanthine dehydrogenase Mo-binding subunit